MKHSVRGFALFVGLLCLLMTGCNAKNYVPNGGEWYCHELGMQLCFDANLKCFVEVDGNEILCITENDRGTNTVLVLCQESDNPCYSLGKCVFEGECIGLSGNILTVCDSQGNNYIFVRQ